MNEYIFTSESITEGHPDKICDNIADSILDEALRQDPNSHMAVEVSIKDDLVIIFGEMNSNAEIDFEKIAKDTIKEIGYDEDYNVLIKVGKQSNEINTAVSKDNIEIGAGDQGIMFGYACTDTDEFMPMPIYYAHKLAERLAWVRKNSENGKCLKPDGKTQVSVKYVDNKPVAITDIIISTQHTKDTTQEDLEQIILNEVIIPCIPAALVANGCSVMVNPSGSFVIGGSFGDSGTTGRKIVCDTYGGKGHIGGGCFSSKDPSKVDRSAAYYCRYVAKSLVAQGYADEIEIQVSYAIGKPNPVSIYVNTFGTEKVDKSIIDKVVNDNFDFSVKNIIDELDLKKPIYKQTANYGHFGNESYPWEQIKPLGTD